MNALEQGHLNTETKIHSVTRVSVSFQTSGPQTLIAPYYWLHNSRKVHPRLHRFTFIIENMTSYATESISFYSVILVIYCD